MKCRLCKSTRLSEFLDLGHHPPSDQFVKKKDINSKFYYYPLKVVMCNKCKFFMINDKSLISFVKSKKSLIKYMKLTRDIDLTDEQINEAKNKYLCIDHNCTISQKQFINFEEK